MLSILDAEIKFQSQVTTIVETTINRYFFYFKTPVTSFEALFSPEIRK